MIDQTRYWMVPGDPQHIAAFLRAHPPPGIPNNGAGWLGTAGSQTISCDVTDTQRGNSEGSPADLDFTVAALGAGNGRHPGRCRGGRRRRHVLLFRRTRTRAATGQT